LHFTYTHFAFGFLELMYGRGDTVPIEFYGTDPATGHNVPQDPVPFGHPEGLEMVLDWLAGRGLAFSKAAKKGKGKGEGKGEGKGDDKGKGEGEGKGKDSDILDAGKASGRRRSRSRSRRHVVP
jgi:hypothetical protein